MPFINESSTWAKLHQHQRAISHVHMRDLFKEDPQRFDKMHCTLHHMLLDYSKNRITNETVSLLIELAHTACLSQWIDKMRRGDSINLSEHRAVLHTALRQPEGSSLIVNGENILKKVHIELNRALALAESIKTQNYKGFNGEPINHIVNIGIGGSDLGPRMLYQALEPYHQPNIKVDFVSNVDAADLVITLKSCNPSRTLFMVASKSFTTSETMLNGKTAIAWFIKQTGQRDISRHFVAITNNKDAALDYGIEPKLIFSMFDWVGGRYSLWSSISLAVMCAVGRIHFLDFLAGGHCMDQHFFSKPYKDNIPVLMGLIGVWYNTFYKSSSHAIIPYDHSLRRFPAYIQQLDMESNGKQVGRNGEHLVFDTGAVIWGEEGVNCQHAFFQLLHQGTRLICSDFILVANNFYPEYLLQHQMLLANGIAQTRALMQGKTKEEVEAGLHALSNIEKSQLASQKYFPGNQPSNTLFLKQLTPFNLGMLVALYEHKVFVQGIIWGINSFDQWGVEYGKVLAQHIEPLLRGQGNARYDSSTNALIDYYHQMQEK